MRRSIESLLPRPLSLINSIGQPIEKRVIGHVINNRRSRDVTEFAKFDREGLEFLIAH